VSGARGRQPDEGSARRVLQEHWRRARTLLRRLPRDLTADNVHASRVAVRRLRTVLAALAPGLDPVPLDRVRRDLKDIAAELGAARDADIRCAILLPMLPALDTTGTLATQLRGARHDARRRLRARLRSAAAGHRLERISRTLAAETFIVPAADPDALLARATDRQCRKLARSLERRRESPARRHAMRIRAKKCRYLLDACHAQPRHGRAIRAQLRDLQDCLGDLNDLEQTSQWLAGRPSTPAARAVRGTLRAATQESRSRLDSLRGQLRPRALRALP
jgi:CHAD domain-containing protein